MGNDNTKYIPKEEFDEDFYEGLYHAMYGGGPLSEEDKALAREMFESKELDDEINEMLAEQHDKKKANEIGRAMYERIMAHPNNTAPRFIPEPKRIPLYKRSIYRVAAVLVPFLLITGAIGVFVSNRNKVDVTNGYAALDTSDRVKELQTLEVKIEAVDGHKDVELPDGTKIKLENGATLAYNSQVGFDRKVHLTGDAFFSVTKREGKTFEVICEDMTVRVLGTEFFVGRNAEQTEVALKSGSVEINTKDESVMLKPNQKFVMSSMGKEFSVLEISDAEMARLYKGRLELRNVTLHDALQKTGEFYGVRMELPSAMNFVDNVLVEFDTADTLEDVLFALKTISNGAFEFQISESGVIIKNAKL